MRLICAFSLLLSLLCPSAEAQNNPLSPALTCGFTDEKIYGINLTSGSFSSLATLTGASPDGITLLDPTTALVVGFNNSKVYRVDLTSGSSSVITTVGGAVSGLGGASLQNATTLITAGFSDGGVYSVNLANGHTTTIATIGALEGLSGVAVLDPSTVLISSLTTTKIYRVNLTNGQTSVVTTIAGAGLYDIAVLDPNTAITVGSGSNKVYRVNLTTGDVTTIATVTGAGLSGVALLNPNTAIVVGSTTDKVYSVDLTNGTVTAITATMTGVDPVYFALPPQIFTTSISGNNTKLANYVNSQAPYSTIRLFTLQPNLADALYRAAPTRNAVPTFTAQTTQLLMGQPLVNHLAQWRWRSKAPQAATQVAAVDVQESNELIASNELLAGGEKAPASPASKTCGTYTPWIDFFGDYAHESKQSQTPAFNSWTGGFVAACDYQGINYAYPIGFGLAYAHSYIHEDDKMGHANTDQVSLALYSTFTRCQRYYVDFAVWGGYYHTDNERHIVFPGFAATATSSIHGWQLAPHIEFGYDYLAQGPNNTRNWFGIEPFAMADWISTWERGFNENGAGALNFGQNGRWASLLRTEAGFRFDERLTYQWGTLTIREKASYAYQKAFGTGSITAFLVGSPGTFTVTTLDTAQNLGVAELEFLFSPRNKKYPRGSFGYQGEYGSKYQSHQAMVKLAMDF